jgi:hypothetical protein
MISRDTPDVMTRALATAHECLTDEGGVGSVMVVVGRIEFQEDSIEARATDLLKELVGFGW